MAKGESARRVGLAMVCALSVVLAVGAVVPPVEASSDMAVPITTFSEASACGGPYVGTPIMPRSGTLYDSDRILGPMGRILGRTVGEVRSDLVDWVVPMSGGRTVKVHRAALPAFQQVTARLDEAASRGLWYSIDSAAAFVPRTIGGKQQISRHALGLAIDINPRRNPASNDPTSWTTDMPQWFVQAWRDSGFCWGGDWLLAKDPMHFSWMGPAPGSGGLPLLPPLGFMTPYTRTTSFPTGWSGLPPDQGMLLADMSGFGATDVVRLRDHPNGTLVEILSARSSYSRCSLGRLMVQGASTADGVVALGDLDGDSRGDAAVIGQDGTLSVAFRADRFAETVTSTVPVPSGLRLAAVADVTGDRRGDLHLLGDGGEVTVLAAPAFDTVVARYTVDPDVVSLVGGDRNGDGVPEMFAMTSTGRVDILSMVGTGFQVTETVDVGPGALTLGAADMDGDGRSDLTLLQPDGSLDVWIGNTPTGRPVSSWFVNPDYECPDQPIPFVYSGTFYDDDQGGYQWAIEEIAAEAITRGCNPPFDDAFCPEGFVTRGQMAAFLSRALSLPPPTRDWFTDDDGSPFEDDINRLAEAGVTNGCDVGRYCPDALVRRDEMAGMLSRALALPASSTDWFTDDDGSPFEAAIDAVADAGITLGCGPASFCPSDPVLREQMAAFLSRR